MDKLKELESLVAQAAARISKTEQENYALKTRLRNIENSMERLRRTEEEAKSLKEWKRSTQSELKKLAVKIEKEIQKTKEQNG